MPSLSIKDVPDDMADQLRRRAARHHRSLQGELMAILSAALQTEASAGPGPEPTAPEASAAETHGARRQGHLSPAAFVERLRQRWPAPIDSGPLAVDILRSDRDAR